MQQKDFCILAVFQLKTIWPLWSTDLTGSHCNVCVCALVQKLHLVGHSQPMKIAKGRAMEIALRTITFTYVKKCEQGLINGEEGMHRTYTAKLKNRAINSSFHNIIATVGGRAP